MSAVLEWKKDVVEVTPFELFMAEWDANRDGFAYGGTVKRHWFWTAFGIEQPKDADTIDDVDSKRFKYLHNMTVLRDRLLIEKQIALKSAYGVGMLIVHPKDQADWATNDLKVKTDKCFDVCRARIQNTAVQHLDDQERLEQTRMLVKTNSLRSLIKAETFNWSKLSVESVAAQ